MSQISIANWKATRYQKKLVKQVLRSGRLTYGPKTKEFERQFASIHGWDNALFTSSGTDALKIAIGALKDKYGWRDGDEVLIPAVTFVATMNAVIMNNLTPVLVDVELETCNIDPKKIARSISGRTVAIIPVHLLGQPADMLAIMKIAYERGLAVIEDSCETMFVPTGPHGDIACYSTYIAHLLVTGVGGLITTDDDELATVMRSMMFHGRDESYLTMDDKSNPNAHYRFPRFGYSDRLTEFEAALGLGGLKDWKLMLELRQFNARYLMDRLSQFKSPDRFPVTKVENHAFMFLPLLVPERDALAEFLDTWDIHTRHIMPLINQPLVKPYLIKRYPNAEMIEKEGILLPCHQYLTKSDMDYMAERIQAFYANP